MSFKKFFRRSVSSVSVLVSIFSTAEDQRRNDDCSVWIAPSAALACVFGSLERDGVNETADGRTAERVCGWSGERRALRPPAEAVGCRWKWTVKGRRSSLSEITIWRNCTGRGKQASRRDEPGAAEGPGRLPLQSSSFTPGKRRGSPVAPNKLSIEFNSWTSNAGPGKPRVPSQKILVRRPSVCSIWARVTDGSGLLDYR